MTALQAYGFVGRYTLYVPATSPNETFGMDVPFHVAGRSASLGNVSRAAQLAKCGSACSPMRMPDGSLQVGGWVLVAG